MRWRVETFEERKDRISNWHSWFAWHPVRIGKYFYWLEVVERRTEFWTQRRELEVFWEYRAKEGAN